MASFERLGSLTLSHTGLKHLNEVARAHPTIPVGRYSAAENFYDAVYWLAYDLSAAAVATAPLSPSQIEFPASVNVPGGISSGPTSVTAMPSRDERKFGTPPSSASPQPETSVNSPIDTARLRRGVRTSRPASTRTRNATSERQIVTSFTVTISATSTWRSRSRVAPIPTRNSEAARIV